MRTGQKLPGNDTLLVVCAQTWYLKDTSQYRLGSFPERIKKLVAESVVTGWNIVLLKDESRMGPLFPDVLALVADYPHAVTLEEEGPRINRAIFSRVKESDKTVRIVGMNALIWVLDVAKWLLEWGIKPSIVLDAILERRGGASPWMTTRLNEIPHVLETYREAWLSGHVDTSGYRPEIHRSLFDFHPGAGVTEED